MKKEILTQVVPSGFCEIFKNTFFCRTPLPDCFWIIIDEHHHLWVHFMYNKENKLSVTCKKFQMWKEASSYSIYVNYTKHNSIMKLNRFTDILFCLKTLTLQKKKCFAFFNKSPLKMMEKTFYFILKALFVLQIPKFLSWLFGQVEKTPGLET